MAFYIVKVNWWRKSDEPWITSASFINAFLSWGICIFGICLGLWISLASIVFLVMIPLANQLDALFCCRWRSWKSTRNMEEYWGWALRKIFINFPNTLCCYLLGRSFHELTRAFSDEWFNKYDQHTGSAKWEKSTREFIYSHRIGNFFTYLPQQDCALCLLPLKDEDKVHEPTC